MFNRTVNLGWDTNSCTRESVCVCVCERERERKTDKCVFNTEDDTSINRLSMLAPGNFQGKITSISGRISQKYYQKP